MPYARPLQFSLLPPGYWDRTPRPVKPRTPHTTPAIESIIIPMPMPELMAIRAELDAAKADAAALRSKACTSPTKCLQRQQRTDELLNLPVGRRLSGKQVEIALNSAAAIASDKDKEIDRLTMVIDNKSDTIKRLRTRIQALHNREKETLDVLYRCGISPALLAEIKAQMHHDVDHREDIGEHIQELTTSSGQSMAAEQHGQFNRVEVSTVTTLEHCEETGVQFLNDTREIHAHDWTGIDDD